MDKDTKMYLDLKLDPMSKKIDEISKKLDSFVTKENCQLIQKANSKKNFMNLSDRQFNVLVGAICSIIGAIFGINI
jgi:hypothetical protein